METKNLDALKKLYAALGGSPNAVKGDKLLAGVIEKIADTVAAGIDAKNGAQYVDFTVSEGSVVDPAADTILAVCALDDAGSPVVARVSDGGDKYYLPLVMRRDLGTNGAYICFSALVANYRRYLNGQRYPNGTETWSYTAKQLPSAEN